MAKLITSSFIFLIITLNLIQLNNCQPQTWNLDPNSGGGLSQAQEKQIDPGFDILRFGCTEDVSINSIRDFEMTDENFLR